MSEFSRFTAAWVFMVRSVFSLGAFPAPDDLFSVGRK